MDKKRILVIVTNRDEFLAQTEKWRARAVQWSEEMIETEDAFVTIKQINATVLNFQSEDFTEFRVNGLIEALEAQVTYLKSLNRPKSSPESQNLPSPVVEEPKEVKEDAQADSPLPEANKPQI